MSICQVYMYTYMLFCVWRVWRFIFSANGHRYDEREMIAFDLSVVFAFNPIFISIYYSETHCLIIQENKIKWTKK